jgi:cell division protease FtsH
MAWGTSGPVFLGDDLMHSRDYSDETSRVIDEEVERILREQEERAMKLLDEHRGGLEAVAEALLEKETISGQDVTQLVDAAFGRPVHADDQKKTVRLAEVDDDEGTTPGSERPGGEPTIEIPNTIHRR